MGLLPDNMKERFLVPGTVSVDPTLGLIMRALNVKTVKARDEKTGQVLRFYELNKNSDLFYRVPEEC